MQGSKATNGARIPHTPPATRFHKVHDEEMGYGLAPGRSRWPLSVVVWLALRGLPDGRLHVYFLDVGQGDAILVQAPDGRQILVDGGPSPTALQRRTGRCAAVLGSQPRPRRADPPGWRPCNGLIPLFDRFAIGAALDGGTDDSAAATAWRNAADAAGTSPQAVVRGMRVRAGAAELAVLNPDSRLGRGKRQ